jgi:uncharacterized protein (DUF1800 family)
MDPGLRRFRVLRPLLTAALVGCTTLLAGQPTSAVPARADDRQIVHVLNRLAFGPGPGDVERVRRLGVRAYIDQQLHPERLPDAAVAARLAGFETLTKSTRELALEYFLPAQMARREQQRQTVQDPSMTPGTQPSRRDTLNPEQMEALRAQRTVLTELAQQKILRAVYSERQLQEVMVDFWFNHFNVFAGKGQTRVYLTEYERDAIRPHALGRFRDLLRATAESPAMLFYLDNWQSAANPDAKTMTIPGGRAGSRMRGPGFFNRPRTMADLPASAQNRRPRGLNENYARELMELHTLGVDGGYTQKDVQEVARAFTGWTIANPRQGGGFIFEPRMHDDGAKLVLGHRIEPGGGRKDGEQVLDVLAGQPATATFISTKLARRFVSDDPPQALVERAAAAFRRTGGDIREVVRVIITSREFFDESAYRAKIKTPFEFVTSAIRATNADARSVLSVVQTLQQLGMPLYGCQPPTGYADKAEAWVNTGALLNRMNFAVALASGRLRGIQMSPAIASQTPADARSALVTEVLAGDLSSSTAGTVAKAEATSQAVALVLGSPEFQRR